MELLWAVQNKNALSLGWVLSRGWNLLMEKLSAVLTACEAQLSVGAIHACHHLRKDSSS